MDSASDPALAACPSRTYKPPPGFEVLVTAARIFVLERARLIERIPLHLAGYSFREEKRFRYENARHLVCTALGSGNLVAFLDSDGDLIEVPARWWLYEHAISKLWPCGKNDPIELGDDDKQARGVAIVDKTNFELFARFAGNWPPFELPAVVQLMLDVCDDLAGMSRELPVQKADVIVLLRAHWPAVLEQIWPTHRRLATEQNKDDCPTEVSRLAEAVLWPKKSKGGPLKREDAKIITDRRKLRDPRRSRDKKESSAGLSVIDDTPSYQEPPIPVDSKQTLSGDKMLSDQRMSKRRKGTADH